MKAIAMLVGSLLLVVACHRRVEVVTSHYPVSATVRDASGTTLGELTFTQTSDGVRVSGALTPLPAGVHGIHLHQVGKCEPPAFTSAGGHLNPATKQHGLQNPAGPHAGDMPNLTVDASGRATVDIITNRVTLDSSGPLFDADGTAIVVHAAADDQKTDPAGNAGARIACGVITRDTGD